MQHVPYPGAPGLIHRRNIRTPTILLRLRLVFIAAAFMACLVYSYNFYLSPVWAYMGYPAFDTDLSSDALLLACISVLFFAFILPPRITLYSHFVVSFLFFFLYIPTVIIASMQGLELDGGISLLVHLMIAWVLIVYIPEIRAPDRLKKRQIQPVATIADYRAAPPASKDFERKFLLIYALVMVVIFVVFGRSMKLVSFSNVYDLRAANHEISGNGALASYLLSWLKVVIAPFLITVGLIYKRHLYTMLGMVAFLIVYMIIGSKSVPILIFLIFVMRYFVLNTRDILSERMGLVALTGLAVPLFIITLYGLAIGHGLDVVMSQAIKRLFGTPGMVVGLYSEFFRDNPVTYYSHIKPVNLWIDYPYDMKIGSIIGETVLGTTEFNLSANFWATDGIVALGHIGIVIIGFILGCLLFAMNSWSSPDRLRFLCMCSFGTIWALMNTSVFRVVLSGGWPLHFLFVYLWYLQFHKTR